MASVLAALKGPESVELALRTLMPLHTGGIGQDGEQFHPSGFLGSIRHFSCLLARALGDSDFEREVWGETPAGNDLPSAKQVGVRCDPSELKGTWRPNQVRCPCGGGHPAPVRGWYYGKDLAGLLTLVLTRRNISDQHWRLLLIALRIQLQHATFCAKDQFGLGVLAAESLPPVSPFEESTVASLPGPSIANAFFAKVHFDCDVPQGDGETRYRRRLEAGLRWRCHLRGALRGPGVPSNTVVSSAELRHYVMGYIRGGDPRSDWGSAVNVSGAYSVQTAPGTVPRSELRIWGTIPHTLPNGVSPSDRREVVGLPYAGTVAAFVETNRAAVVGLLERAILAGPPVPCASVSVDWTPGPGPGQTLIGWINELAGLGGTP